MYVQLTEKRVILIVHFAVEAGFPSVSQDDLEHTMFSKSTLNSQSSKQSLLGSRLIEVHHHVQLKGRFSNHRSWRLSEQWGVSWLGASIHGNTLRALGIP